MSSRSLGTCVICSALPVELAAVRVHLLGIAQTRDGDGTIFETGSFETAHGSWTVGLAETGMGNVHAALLTQQAIRHFRPRVVLFVGVAGGIKDVTIGDVVVATKVYEYSRGKQTKTAFLPRPEVRTPSFRILQEARVVSRMSSWRDGLVPPPTGSPQIHLGPVAAGEAVISATRGQLYQHIQKHYSDTLAVEMEGSGFLNAAYISNNDALVIRGISDLLNLKAESDAAGSQELAARHASAVAFAVLDQLGSQYATGALPQAPSDSQTHHAEVGTSSAPIAAHVPHNVPSYPSTPTSPHGVVTHIRNSVDPSNVGSFIEANDWIVGAVNFDEDLHFSSFYTRQSCAPYLTGDVAVFGYSGLIAIYEDFRETYYIPRSECIRVAQAILDRIVANPVWMQEVLDEIHTRSKALQDVFKDDLTPFDRLSDRDLLAQYQAHNIAHARLYQVARIPEAMDRGVALFTNYLKNYLRKRGALLAKSPKELNRVFELLTFPEEMSAIKREMGEFHELLEAIKASTEGVSLLSGGGRRAWLKMPPSLRAKLESHRHKWGYLGYHGYGTRTLPDLDHYLQRVTSMLSQTADPLWRTADYDRVLADAEVRRVGEFTKYRIDETHQFIFRLHSRIGIAKLYRRYVQLRNFVYLDQLLSDVSRRKDCPEQIIRCLLPEEVDRLLVSQSRVEEQLQCRTEFAAHVIEQSAEGVLGGKEFAWIRDQLGKKIHTRVPSSTRLEGTPAFAGVVRGRCKVIVRPADAERVNFQPGDILISESTDPDLVPLIQLSSGVATEQGGVTSHAAIVCRELGKPALVGVTDLLAVVKNDDYAVLNAEEGYLSIVRLGQRHWTMADAVIEESEATRLGAKAYNLSVMLKRGIKVPRFFVVPLDTVGGEILAIARDATGEPWEGLRSEIVTSLEYLGGELFAVRTSMPDEDSPTFSHAGQFETESHVERQDVVARVVRQILTMPGRNGGILLGSIIVQEMVLGDFSGICFSRDPTDTGADNMLIEAVPGGNDALTSGKVVPARYRLGRETFLVSRDESALQWQDFVPPEIWHRLGKVFLRIEVAFGAPQDIEWTVKSHELWVLQARPITAHVSGSGSDPGQSYARRLASGPRDISSVYSAYRVPPNLKLHMLRVAAVASLICDNWTGPALNRATIIVTGLLHDIGNIAKVNYDAFPTLLPEEIQDLEYWKAVQAHIRARYGSTDQEVTMNIARELDVPERVITLLELKTFVQNDVTEASSDWELKVSAYSDQRVGPSGVMPLLERLAEARERYRGVPFASVNDPKYPTLVECAQTIERQIASHLRIVAEDITDAAIERYMDGLREFIV